MTWSVSDYNTTPGSNTAINGINIAEECNASGINDAIRQLMADIAAGPWILGANNLSDITNAGTARANLGLGTAAVAATGTSGATLPFLNGTNTWAAFNTFSVGASFGDANYFNQIQAGNPYVYFDTADYLFYDRTSNFFSVVINSVEALRVTSAGITIGGVAAGGTTATHNADYTFVLGDAGGTMLHTSGSHTWTLPQNASVAYPTGTRIKFLNSSTGTVTVSCPGGGALLLSGSGSVGSVGLASYGAAYVDKVAADTWLVSGNVA